MLKKEILQEIYEQLKVPYKVGAIIKQEGRLIDSPIVFKVDEKYYMTYVSIDSECKGGYITHLATSDDLLHWDTLGEIAFKRDEWDCAQLSAYAQLQDINFGGTNELLKIDNKYLLAYIGGSKYGYETDPLSMGIATTEDLLDLNGYFKYAKPIFSGSDVDARKGETLTIYKANMFFDEAKTTGFPYVCAYNGKDETLRESIYLAVSQDGIHWQRYLNEAIISVFDCADTVRINGDPQIIKMGEYYVMLYFIYDTAVGAYNTFAVSKDLKNWTKWEGKPLVESEYEWENVYAHKQWVIKENGIVYHFYCAVNKKKERFIALAKSEE